MGTENSEIVASEDATLASRVRIAAWSILPIAGLIDALYSRYAMQSDGISYLDIGDAMMRGEWKTAINGVWSPLYPWLQGLALRLFKPSAYWEFTVVHLVNFLIYLFALACFDFMLRVAAAGQSVRNGSAVGTSPLPRWAALALGYSIFLWSSLSLITMERVTPDLLMAGFLYLAMGLLLQIWQRPQGVLRFVLLGSVLGLGYLAKAPMFPISIIFFILSWILVGNWHRALPRVSAAVLVFLAISALWFVPLSRAKGRFTFGDSARYNYVVWVNHASPVPYWQSVGTAGGHYTHPVRKISNAPPIYEFSSPLNVTMPVWYDPSYWADGAIPRVSLTNQLQVIHYWLMVYLDMLFPSQGALFVGFFVLCLMGGRELFVRQMTALWPVWLVGLAGLGMYVLVQVDPRYVAVFFTLFWVGLYSGLLTRPDREHRRLVSLVTLAVVIAIAGPVVRLAAGHLDVAVRGQPQDHWQVAEDLRGMGIKPGDRIARIGGLHDVGWARLLRVTVVAEVPRANAREFWCGKPELQAQVIETLRSLGVAAIVAEETPPDVVFVPGPEWHKLGDGMFYALRFAPDSVR